MEDDMVRLEALLNEDIEEEEDFHQRFEGMAGATAFLNLPNAELSLITHLYIILDATTWTDGEDDIWAMALTAFAPRSQRLKHLHLTINGQILFTRFNYIKPNIYTTTRHGFPEDADMLYIHEDEADALTSDDEASPPNSPTTASAIKAAKDKAKEKAKAKVIAVRDAAIAAAANQQPNPQPNLNNARPTFREANNPPNERTHELHAESSARVKSYKKQQVPPDTLKLHITAQKAILTALCKLAKPRVENLRVTITGVMELSVRRSLIATLSPDWESDEHSLLQAGYVVDDTFVNGVRSVLGNAEARERNFLSTGRLLSKLENAGNDDGSDHEFSGFGAPAGWKVGTGSAGRVVYGWRAASLQAWRGPG